MSNEPVKFGYTQYKFHKIVSRYNMNTNKEAPPPKLGYTQYNSLRTVQAAKIKSIETFADGSSILHFDYADEVDVSATWVDDHKPVAGGYRVIYSDGHVSFSSAAAFEFGYTEIV